MRNGRVKAAFPRESLKEDSQRVTSPACHLRRGAGGHRRYHCR